MALPTRQEQLQIRALAALREGNLEKIDSDFGKAVKESACKPDLATRKPECKTALLRAVERADLNRITRYVQEFGCDLEFENCNGDTPLSEAFKIGNMPVIKHLLDMGAKLDHVNTMGESMLTHTLRCCQYEALPNTVRWLLSQKGAPFPRPADLTEAIILGHHQIICQILDFHDEKVAQAHKRREAGAEAASKKEKESQHSYLGEKSTNDSQNAWKNEKNIANGPLKEVNASALKDEKDMRETKFAADSNVHRDEIVETSNLNGRRGAIVSDNSDGMIIMRNFKGPILMQKGNGSDEGLLGMPYSLLETIDPLYGRTPLMCAASADAAGTVTMLIERFGANPNRENSAGHTALTIASFHGFDNTVRALIQGGAEVDQETIMGYTALLQSCVAGHAQTARVLCEAGSEVDRQNSLSETAITTAARSGHERVVMVLMTQGANVNFVTRSGRTALHEAMRSNHPKVVETLLLDDNLDLNRMPASSAKLRSPLMVGVANGSDEALSALLRKNVINPTNANKIGLDLHLETPLEETALSVCISEGTASSGLIVIQAMIQQVADENGKSTTQFQAAVLSARMLLSGLQRLLKKAEEKSAEVLARRETAELCQRAQTVVEAVQEGVNDAKSMLEELAVEHKRMISAESGDGEGGKVDLQAAIDAARWTA